MQEMLFGGTSNKRLRKSNGFVGNIYEVKEDGVVLASFDVWLQAYKKTMINFYVLEQSRPTTSSYRVKYAREIPFDWGGGSCSNSGCCLSSGRRRNYPQPDGGASLSSCAVQKDKFLKGGGGWFSSGPLYDGRGSSTMGLPLTKGKYYSLMVGCAFALPFPRPTANTPPPCPPSPFGPHSSPAPD